METLLGNREIVAKLCVLASSTAFPLRHARKRIFVECVVLPHLCKRAVTELWEWKVGAWSRRRRSHGASLADFFGDVEPPDQPTARALSMHQGRRSLQEEGYASSRTSYRLLWRCEHINDQ
ncbi:hypothetical protein TNCV_4252481 [Trichonephila clavipes]|nr:hypothetical protein TNCV_4252481 [Trichonephila clavipes]